MKKLIFKLAFAGLLLTGTASLVSAQTTRVFYDKKGRVRFTIDYYGESRLPGEVRAIVKPVYYDYAILNVQEVKLNGKSIFMIDLQDSSTIKTVRVADGEMELVRTLNRSAAEDRSQGKTSVVRN